MSSEEIKRLHRMRFVEAAKEILLESGVDEVTVRKVGERAGFSYATIYGYFKDREQLLWHVTVSCIEDLVGVLSARLGAPPFTLDSILEAYGEYLSHFIDNPRVFELIFFNRIGNPPEEFAALNAEPEFALTLIEGYDGVLPGAAASDPAARKKLARVMTSSMIGLLTLHVSGKSGMDRAGLLGTARESLRYLLSPAVAEGERGES